MKKQMKIIAASIACLGFLFIQTQVVRAQEGPTCAQQGIHTAAVCLASVLGASVAAAIICAYTHSTPNCLTRS
jgi:hypothetical protein